MSGSGPCGLKRKDLPKDIEEDVLRINGIKIKDEEDNNKFISKPCPRCKESVSPGGKFCSRCGSPFEVITAIQVEDKRNEMDNLMSKLMKDPEVQSFISSKLEKIKVESHQ